MQAPPKARSADFEDFLKRGGVGPLNVTDNVTVSKPCIIHTFTGHVDEMKHGHLAGLDATIESTKIRKTDTTISVKDRYSTGI